MLLQGAAIEIYRACPSMALFRLSGLQLDPFGRNVIQLYTSPRGNRVTFRRMQKPSEGTLASGPHRSNLP